MSKENQIQKEVIHCRASGNTINVSKDWQMGEECKFMWMPAGVHQITAGITRATAQGMVDKTVHMTVLCDQQTAETVQASFEEWLQERPKQKPYGCVEHREQEATVLAKGFEWRDGEEGGVYLAAEPTALGVQNVNGKIHRSWSPSFTTDAETNKAVEKNGVLMFPPGARGSAQNPARITGVDFVVGTLTNKPAFRNISPVKAREGFTGTGVNEEGEVVTTLANHANPDEVVTATEFEVVTETEKKPDVLKAVAARKQAADELIKAAASRNKPELVIPENETTEQILARLGKGIVKGSGTSEGNIKAWETRKAEHSTLVADLASKNAKDKESHKKASDAHLLAETHHRKAVQATVEDRAASKNHTEKAQYHADKAREHFDKFNK